MTHSTLKVKNEPEKGENSKILNGRIGSYGKSLEDWALHLAVVFLRKSVIFQNMSKGQKVKTSIVVLQRKLIQCTIYTKQYSRKGNVSSNKES
jgi:hypothetical protein